MSGRAKENQHASASHWQDDVSLDGGSGRSSESAHATKKAGDAAVRRMAAVPGLEDPDGLAMESFSSVDVEVTAVDGQEIFRKGPIRVRFDDNTRFSARLDTGGMHLDAEPGLEVVAPGPNFRLTSVFYDFDSASFQLSGGASVDICGAYAEIVKTVAEYALNKKVKPSLPKRMRRAGYSTESDPDLRGTLSELADAFKFGDEKKDEKKDRKKGAGKERSNGQGAPVGGGARLIDPSLLLSLSVPSDLHIPLGNEKLEFYLKAGTSIDLGVEGSGAVDKLKLRQLDFSSFGPGIEIQSTGKGLVDAFMGVTINRITIKPGGKFDFDYDLRPEQIGNGLGSLVTLLGMASGHNPGRLPEAKLHGVRKVLDARLQEMVPPRFREFLAQFDNVLPGCSLLDIFGM